MPIYSATLPWHVLRGLSDDMLITTLTGMGSISYEFSGEFPNRRVAVNSLAEETEWLGLDRIWWQENLSRGKTIRKES